MRHGSWCCRLRHRRWLGRRRALDCGTRLFPQNGLVQHGSEFVAIGTACLLYLRRRQGLLHALCRSCGRKRRGLSKVAEPPFEFFNTLSQRPFETLRISHACLQPHATIIGLTQQPLKLGHMRSQPLDDGVGGLLQLFFQFFNRGGKILIVLLTALSAVDDVPNHEQKNSAENDECAQNFGDGNNNRMPPLSVVPIN